MNVRDRTLRLIARQLGHPAGLPGRVVGRVLNRRNAGSITAAVEALPATQPAQLADLGLGGGVGLSLLLERAGADGRVHGVELSDMMLHEARGRFRRQIASGRLEVHRASLESLPLDDRSLSGAITLNTVYFLEDLTGAFSELARVLQPGGVVVVGVDDPDAMAHMPFTSHGFRLRPIDDLQASLAEAGLTVTAHDRVGDGPTASHLLCATRTAPSNGT